MYKLLKHSLILRLPDNVTIPQDIMNPDYKRYLEWVAEGNQPLPVDPDPIVPVISVTMRQARLALLQSGLLSTVEAAISSMPGVEGQVARIEWEYATTLDKSHPLTLAMAQTLSFTEQQLDELFQLASTL